MKIMYSRNVFILSFILIACVYLILYFNFDIAISQFALDLKLNNYSSIKSFNEICGNIVFQVAVFCMFLIYFFSKKNLFAQKILFVAITIVVAMLFKDVLKWLFGRARPVAYFKDHMYGMQWFQSSDLFHSTPSGHSIRAMSLCMSLFLLCKNNLIKIVLLIFAVAQALCRVILLRHYLSDVILGMWLGFFIAVYVHSIMFTNKD